MTTTRHHPATYFISGFALALLLSAAPVRRIFGGGMPNTFVAGEVASADEVNANFDYLESRVDDLQTTGVGVVPVLLGSETRGSLLLPPSVLPGDVEQELVTMDISAPSSGTAIVRLEAYLRDSDEQPRGTLRLNGTPIHLHSLELNHGGSEYEGVSESYVGCNSLAFHVPIDSGPHQLSFSVRNRDFLINDFEWYQVVMSAWFVAD